MKILAIDVGETTGIAYLDDRGEIKFTCDVPIEKLSELLMRFIWEDDLRVVVEEAPPQRAGPLSRSLSRANGIVDNAFPDAEKIPPGVWKPVMKSSLKDLDFPSTHQRDAAGLGLYFYRKIGKEALRGLF